MPAVRGACRELVLGLPSWRGMASRGAVLGGDERRVSQIFRPLEAIRESLSLRPTRPSACRAQSTTIVLGAYGRKCRDSGSRSDTEPTTHSFPFG